MRTRRIVILLLATIGFLWLMAKGVYFGLWLAAVIISFVNAHFASLIILTILLLGFLWLGRHRKRKQELLTLDEWLMMLGEEIRR